VTQINAQLQLGDHLPLRGLVAKAAIGLSNFGDQIVDARDTGDGVPWLGLKTVYSRSIGAIGTNDVSFGKKNLKTATDGLGHYSKAKLRFRRSENSLTRTVGMDTHPRRFSRQGKDPASDKRKR